MKLERWIARKWKHYRYRFVPWLAWNLRNTNTNSGIRTVTQAVTDVQPVSQDDFAVSLHNFLGRLHQELSNISDDASKPAQYHEKGLEVQQEISGFTIERRPSNLVDGGTGVKVTAGTVPEAYITSLYPGLIYERYDPILFQSIANPFIFRCADGVLIDGNDKRLSKSLFKSCRGRDSCWPLPACDASWLTELPQCPLNVGQYVNNHTQEFPANVAYQEFFLPVDFPARLRQYLPNNYYTPSSQIPSGTHRVLRIVALVSLREIQCGEELFSSYFTLVR